MASGLDTGENANDDELYQTPPDLDVYDDAGIATTDADVGESKGPGENDEFKGDGVELGWLVSVYDGNG